MRFISRKLPGLALLTVGAAAAAPLCAQTAAGESVAEISRPSTVQKLEDLQFGDIIAGSTVSTVVVNPSSESRSIQTGNATAFGGTVSAAQFQVSARPLLYYQISLPSSTTLTRISGSETMLVNNFTLNGSSIRFLPLFTAIGNFKVGGRLTVGAGQEPGQYSGSFVVTVNYL
jgi:hypothetical protein